MDGVPLERGHAASAPAATDAAAFALFGREYGIIRNDYGIAAAGAGPRLEVRVRCASESAIAEPPPDLRRPARPAGRHRGTDPAELLAKLAEDGGEDETGWDACRWATGRIDARSGR